MTREAGPAVAAGTPWVSSLAQDDIARTIDIVADPCTVYQKALDKRQPQPVGSAGARSSRCFGGSPDRSR
jgi:hypothetical protein